jgi:hypothetical protein
MQLSAFIIKLYRSFIIQACLKVFVSSLSCSDPYREPQGIVPLPADDFSIFRSYDSPQVLSSHIHM